MHNFHPVPTPKPQLDPPMQAALPLGAVFWPPTEGCVPAPAAIAEPLVERWTLHNGAVVTVRPIRPQDEMAMIAFHRSLSEESVYLRYSHLIKLNHRIDHDRLRRICTTEGDREWVFVAEWEPPPTVPSIQSAPPAIVAVARLNKLPDNHTAEFALIVSDDFQHQGLGSRLLSWLLYIAQTHQIDHVIAEMLPENSAMEHLCQKQGFQLHNYLADGVVTADLDLIPTAR